MAELIRKREGAKIWRWERRGDPWAGATRWISVEGLEVILGQRLSADSPALEARCGLDEFVSGCFHKEVKERFGAEVLAEALKEVSQEAPPKAAATPKPSEEPPREPRRVLVTAQGVKEAPARAGREAVSVALAAATDREVGLTLTRCERVDLTLAAALKELLGVKAGELGRRLGRLPATLAGRLERASAEGVQRRLEALGVEVVLSAAS